MIPHRLSVFPGSPFHPRVASIGGYIHKANEDMDLLLRIESSRDSPRVAFLPWVYIFSMLDTFIKNLNKMKP
jgi:hypothetical protein